MTLQTCVLFCSSHGKTPCRIRGRQLSKEAQIYVNIKMLILFSVKKVVCCLGFLVADTLVMFLHFKCLCEKKL